MSLRALIRWALPGDGSSALSLLADTVLPDLDVWMTRLWLGFVLYLLLSHILAQSSERLIGRSQVGSNSEWLRIHLRIVRWASFCSAFFLPADSLALRFAGFFLQWLAPIFQNLFLLPHAVSKACLALDICCWNALGQAESRSFMVYALVVSAVSVGCGLHQAQDWISSPPSLWVVVAFASLSIALLLCVYLVDHVTVSMASSTIAAAFLQLHVAAVRSSALGMLLLLVLLYALVAVTWFLRLPDADGAQEFAVDFWLDDDDDDGAHVAARKSRDPAASWGWSLVREFAQIVLLATVLFRGVGSWMAASWAEAAAAGPGQSSELMRYLSSLATLAMSLHVFVRWLVQEQEA